MQRKYLIRAALVLLLVTGSFFVLKSSSRTAISNENCTESMDECCKRKENSASGEMIWETLSRQFIPAAEISN